VRERSKIFLRYQGSLINLRNFAYKKNAGRTSRGERRKIPKGDRRKRTEKKKERLTWPDNAFLIRGGMTSYHEVPPENEDIEGPEIREKKAKKKQAQRT